MVVAVLAAIVAGIQTQAAGRLTWLGLAIGLACAGASVLNNYLDRDIDALMPRTKDRPLPSGRISHKKALFLGIALVIAAMVTAWQLGYLAELEMALGVLLYVVAYTLWLKRRTYLSIIVGGLAGSRIAMTAWFAVSAQLSLLPFLAALIIFLWMPGHFWSVALAHKDEYRAAKIPMLPAVIGEKATARYILLDSILLNIVALLPFFFGGLGKIYLLGAAHLSGLFVIASIRLWKRPVPGRAQKNYRLSVIVLLGIFLFMAIDVMVSGLWAPLR